MQKHKSVYARAKSQLGKVIKKEGQERYCLSVCLYMTKNSRFVLRDGKKEKRKGSSFDSEGYTKNTPHISQHMHTTLRDNRERERVKI